MYKLKCENGMYQVFMSSEELYDLRCILGDLIERSSASVLFSSFSDEKSKKDMELLVQKAKKMRRDLTRRVL